MSKINIKDLSRILLTSIRKFDTLPVSFSNIVVDMLSSCVFSVVKYVDAVGVDVVTFSVVFGTGNKRNAKTCLYILIFKRWYCTIFYTESNIVK